MPKKTGEKVERAGAAALLLLSRKAGLRASSAASSGVDDAVARSARESSKDRPRKAALFIAVALASQRMAGEMRKALQGARRAAREGAVTRLGAELAALKIVASPGLLSAGIGGRDDEDEVRAASAADAVAATWRAGALYAASRAFRAGESPARAIEGTRSRVSARAALAARNEVAEAYNDEHVRAIAGAAAKDPELADALAAQKVVRVWSAAFEKNTCARCAAHDGETAPAGENFTGGDEPGEVHANCLCTSYLSTEG